MIYFDVRPSAHLPTVELRICDACARLEGCGPAGRAVPRAGHPGDRRRAGGPGGADRPAELLEAATWRAAQSGLDGNLVDPATAIPVPAHQLIGQLLADLRPMLESTGDWELAAELTKSALAGGSSAARQRTASARGGLAKVVDTLLAETRANTDWLPGAGSARATVSALPRGHTAATAKRSCSTAAPAGCTE
jgi:glutamate---cysteine ligase / carboxylate-amine ligase